MVCYRHFERASGPQSSMQKSKQDIFSEASSTYMITSTEKDNHRHQQHLEKAGKSDREDRSLEPGVSLDYVQGRKGEKPTCVPGLDV